MTDRANMALQGLLALICLTPVLVLWAYAISYAYTQGRTNSLLSFHSPATIEKEKSTN